jgi:hypothetical protein
VGTAHQHNNQLFKLQSAVPTLHPKALLTLGARSELGLLEDKDIELLIN